MSRSTPGLPIALALRISRSAPRLAASFAPLGDLPGGAIRSVAHDASADGSVVVGFGHTTRREIASIRNSIDGRQALHRWADPPRTTQ